jgi:hypothetical protein
MRDVKGGAIFSLTKAELEGSVPIVLLWAFASTFVPQKSFPTGVHLWPILADENEPPNQTAKKQSGAGKSGLGETLV